MLKQLNQLFEKALAKQLMTHTLTIKIKYHDFVQLTRSWTLTHVINHNTLITDMLMDLLKNTDTETRPVRLLGITL